MRDIYKPHETPTGFSYREGVVTPAAPESERLAGALFRLIEAKDVLEKKMTSVPSYTGQWDSQDYYADEQEGYNRAADEFAEAVRSTQAAVAVA